MFNILDTSEPRAKVYPTYEAYKLIFYLKKACSYFQQFTYQWHSLRIINKH